MNVAGGLVNIKLDYQRGRVFGVARVSAFSVRVCLGFLPALCLRVGCVQAVGNGRVLP